MNVASTALPPARPPFRFDLKIAAIWGVLAGLAVLALMPYLLQLMPEAFEKLPVPLPAAIALQALQATLLLGLLSLAGLRLGHRVGLGSPVLSLWLSERRLPPSSTLRPLQSMLLGVVAGALVIAASLVIDPLLPAPRTPLPDTAATQSALNGLMASFYGGIAEELQLRLFLMTVLVWLLTGFARRAPGPAVFWIAIVVAAIAFGAGHLPAAEKIWGLDSIVVVRTIGLNAIAGVVFGWVYWRRGLEMAMLSHFSADIVLHVLAPLASLGPTA